MQHLVQSPVQKSLDCKLDSSSLRSQRKKLYHLASVLFRIKWDIKAMKFYLVPWRPVARGEELTYFISAITLITTKSLSLKFQEKMLVFQRGGGMFA